MASGESKKRKRALGLEWVEEALEAEPKDHQVAWNRLRDRMRELKDAGPIPKVSVK